TTPAATPTWPRPSGPGGAAPEGRRPGPRLDPDPVPRLTADAVGEPGQRTFYLQAASGADQVTLLVEKEQVRRLAESLETWLPELASDRPEDPGEAGAAAAGERGARPPRAAPGPPRGPGGGGRARGRRAGPGPAAGARLPGRAAL